MSFFKLVFYIVIGYFLFKLAKAVIRIFTMKNEQVDDSSINTNYTKRSPGNSKIDKKDIIEADFEDIDEKKEN